MASTATSGHHNSHSGTPTGESAPVERRCENADCNASKLLSMVPKRKTSQFVTEPNVMEKPMLINGFTTVFQVDGGSAKLADLKNAPNAGVNQPKTIYRIVPNTHAHIVNYVVVDAEGESLRKINESDPATMRKLLESQKVSADQMLKKLIAGVSVAGGSNNSVPNPTTQTTAATTTTKPMPAGTVVPTQPTTQIQLPVRMHPNLKITAVASSEPAATSAPPTVPLITPVPLSALQNAPPVTRSVAVAPPAGQADNVDKPVFDKMQAELQELRRTVAMLAEAQAKNQLTQQKPPSAASPNTSTASALRAVKRLRQS